VRPVPDPGYIVELTRRKFDTLVIWECQTGDVEERLHHAAASLEG
jgi:hypothetical protein